MGPDCQNGSQGCQGCQHLPHTSLATLANPMNQSLILRCTLVSRAVLWRKVGSTADSTCAILTSFQVLVPFPHSVRDRPGPSADRLVRVRRPPTACRTHP